MCDLNVGQMHSYVHKIVPLKFSHISRYMIVNSFKNIQFTMELYRDCKHDCELMLFFLIINQSYGFIATCLMQNTTTA